MTAKATKFRCSKCGKNHHVPHGEILPDMPGTLVCGARFGDKKTGVITRCGGKLVKAGKP